MPERMAFLPKADVLSFEELDRLCAVFIQNGVRKLRITGGEPLVRKDIMRFLRGLARHLDTGALGRTCAHHQRNAPCRSTPSELAAIGVQTYQCLT